jgi:hypothetical protein
LVARRHGVAQDQMLIWSAGFTAKNALNECLITLHQFC